MNFSTDRKVRQETPRHQDPQEKEDAAPFQNIAISTEDWTHFMAPWLLGVLGAINSMK